VLHFWIYKGDVEFLYIRLSFYFILCYVLQEDLLIFLVMNSKYDSRFGSVPSYLRGAFHYLEQEY